MIKPIQTLYAGILFRSRLEARWAMYFDLLGYEWDYEIEGFSTKFGGYLPDFYLSKIGVFIEIKPYFQSDARWTSLVSGRIKLVVCFGSVSCIQWKVIPPNGDLVECCLAHFDSSVGIGFAFDSAGMTKIQEENQKFCDECNSYRF